MRVWLAEQGVEVYEYAGQEISDRGLGGPTCLTRPLVREAPGSSHETRN